MCSKCKELKSYSEFNKNKNTKDGVTSYCKKCIKIDRENNKNYIINYRLKNKNKHKKQYKKYYKENKISTSIRCKSYQNSNAKYKLFIGELTKEEFPRLANDGVSLEVKCRYCGKYFIPNRCSVNSRVKALDSIGKDHFLYCSNNCKEACPVYKQIKYPKGFKPASSREVNPLVRQMCFEKDNWTCQICGATQNEAPLHCHHIEGYTQNPRLGNDVANTITLCKTCHKKAHKLPGCGYYELRCKN